MAGKETVANLVRHLAGSDATPARLKLQAAKKLRDLSAQNPQLIDPHFDLIERLRHHENAILRWNAILTLANLASVDTACKLDRILESYLAPIRGPHLIDAANTIRGATLIAVHKPALAAMIANRLLKTGRANYATPECRNVAIGHALSSLARLYPLVADRRAIERFVARQARNPRPATRGKAEKLLREWAKP